VPGAFLETPLQAIPSRCVTRISVEGHRAVLYRAKYLASLPQPSIALPATDPYMPRVRQIEIDNFRCIRRLRWSPRPGINALVGTGDAGKSTVLDAIDFCLGARRSITFTDADFHLLDETKPIRIAVTVGELPETLLDLDVYGQFLRGYDAVTETVDDEPGRDHETVLTVVLTVDASLEPTWSLYSERAAAVDHQRSLSWA